MTMSQTEKDRSTADLLLEIRGLKIEESRAEMARARLVVELFQNFSADHQARKAVDPYFTATPLAEVLTEVQPVTGQTVGRIRGDLEAVKLVDAELPWLAPYLDSGRLDLHRARPVTDAVKDDLADHPRARERFSELLQTWFARAAAQADGAHDPGSMPLTKTVKQIRDHVHYLVAKVLASEFDERFKKRHAQRHVSTVDTGDGMAALTIDTDQVSVTKAAKHLDLLARAARKDGDDRTLEQLRADCAIDLLTGEAAGPVGQWARPVINITVPIQTLMGLSDEPGRMGETTLPPTLVRYVAADPDSTWHRMLTDEHRHGVELSTTSYRPTGPITREVVATQPVCFAPTCSRPATESDLDHHERWPEGETRTGNVGPGCKRHHLSKHAPGASLRKSRDGTLRYKLRSGLTHLVSPAEVPVCDDPRAGELWEQLLEIQPNCAELADALEELRDYARHRRLQTLGEARAADRLEADYRASYPDASDEDIEHWVWGNDPTEELPPITRRAPQIWDHAPEEPELSVLVS